MGMKKDQLEEALASAVETNARLRKDLEHSEMLRSARDEEYIHVNRVLDYEREMSASRLETINNLLAERAQLIQQLAESHSETEYFETKCGDLSDLALAAEAHLSAFKKVVEFPEDPDPEPEPAPFATGGIVELPEGQGFAIDLSQVFGDGANSLTDLLFGSIMEASADA